MNKILLTFFVLLGLTCLISCSAIAGIFKAGVWVGVLAVIIVIAIIVFLVMRGSNKN